MCGCLRRCRIVISGTVLTVLPVNSAIGRVVTPPRSCSAESNPWMRRVQVILRVRPRVLVSCISRVRVFGLGKRFRSPAQLQRRRAACVAARSTRMTRSGSGATRMATRSPNPVGRSRFRTPSG